MDFRIIDKCYKKAFKPLPIKKLETIKHNKHPYHKFLYFLAKNLKPKICLEIGTWHGVGAYHMSCAAPTIAIDIHKPFYADKFHYVQGNSTTQTVKEAVKKYVQKHGKIGLVFQDSSHHYLSSKKEWEIYSEMCDTDAVWVCDDIEDAFYDEKVDPPGKGMVQYFEELPGEKKLYCGMHGKTNKTGVVIKWIQRINE